MQSKDKNHWKDRANLSIAHGALTNSKRPSSFVEGVYPTHITRGQGVYFWDHTGKRYLDYCGANGTNLFGYAHSGIAQAVFNALRGGSLFSIGSTLEVVAAEQLQAVVPHIERLRFLKSGTEACMAAIRIARAATDRMEILSEGYHGWSDEFTALTAPAYGCRTGHVSRLTSIESVTRSTAGVIVEPVITELSKGRKAWLNALKARCKEVGAVLIFDEVITGFRVPKYSISGYWGIKPDISIFGKAMAGGLPLAAVGGRREVMECANEYFVSSTYAGERASLAAFLKVLELLRTTGYQLPELWTTGQQWLERFNSFSKIIQIEGYPTRGVFKGHPEVLAKFWQTACELGIFFGPSWFWCFPHAQLMEQPTLEVIEEIICKIENGEVKLKGAIPRSPFAQQVRTSG